MQFLSLLSHVASASAFFAGISAVAFIIRKMINLLNAEHRLRDELSKYQLNVRARAPEAEQMARIADQIVRIAREKLRGGEKKAVLQALSQPSEAGRNRYMEKLLGPM
jgi:hypothetical protein